MKSISKHISHSELQRILSEIQNFLLRFVAEKADLTDVNLTSFNSIVKKEIGTNWLDTNITLTLEKNFNDGHVEEVQKLNIYFINVQNTRNYQLYCTKNVTKSFVFELLNPLYTILNSLRFRFFFVFFVFVIF